MITLFDTNGVWFKVVTGFKYLCCEFSAKPGDLFQVTGRPSPNRYFILHSDGGGHKVKASTFRRCTGITRYEAGEYDPPEPPPCSGLSVKGKPIPSRKLPAITIGGLNIRGEPIPDDKVWCARCLLIVKRPHVCPLAWTRESLDQYMEELEEDIDCGI